MNINTPQGIKTPDEAARLFKQGMLNAGALLGLYKQLIEHAPEQAAEVTRWINENPAGYSDKITRLAKEQASGRATGAKRITSEAQALELLRSFGLRPQLRITFCSDAAKRVSDMVVLHPKYFKFHDESAPMLLMHCVRASGEWQGVTRTYTITVNDPSGAALEVLAHAMASTIESVELMYNMNDRAEAMEKAICEPILRGRPDLFYDESIFREVCGELFDHGGAVELLVNKIADPNAPFASIAALLPPGSRAEFLEAYIESFDAALAPA